MEGCETTNFVYGALLQRYKRMKQSVSDIIVPGGSRKEGHDNLVSVIWRYLDQQFYNYLSAQASRIK